ncbi:cyclin-A2-1-like [Typha latifolia]|uniref:cyclin-A2-1-like n=1 Tax=Typha latifolia TaxID=4733 RepID=UPI003C2D1D3C
MKKDNPVIAGQEVPIGRITRARAAANRANGGVPPLLPPRVKPDQSHAIWGNLKRAALDENNTAASRTSTFQHKKRAVLKDVTNVCCENLRKDCIPMAKLNPRGSQSVKLGTCMVKQCTKKGPKVNPTITCEKSSTRGITSSKQVDEVQDFRALESNESAAFLKVEEHILSLKNEESVRHEESVYDTVFFEENSFRDQPGYNGDSKNGDSIGLGIINIDNENANPQMCSIYASEIYTNLRAAELSGRPCSNFMETLQRDITQSMRGILIDWLVEVSEEYRLVPDTLYLTIYLIDWFLSQNYIERQRLQLLGITCMLIASKYEEICAPRVEEFCFITDNTYSKAEVLKMENQVLSYIGFQLSVPTVKTFLRRFLRAAQACQKAPCLALGYLTNYLAELTLVEYSFLKFLPSRVAASAVFLARWTLDQSDHPWNLTLEHYTSYKSIDLRVTVLALQELQLNSKSCPLNAIREKYRQQKFEAVATLTSPELLPSLFC